jgi:hypothetical protein
VVARVGHQYAVAVGPDALGPQELAVQVARAPDRPAVPAGVVKDLDPAVVGIRNEERAVGGRVDAQREVELPLGRTRAAEEARTPARGEADDAVSAGVGDVHRSIGSDGDVERVD